MKQNSKAIRELIRSKLLDFHSMERYKKTPFTLLTVTRCKVIVLENNVFHLENNTGRIRRY